MDNPESIRPRRKHPRKLSVAEWNALLAALDSDPTRAAEKYETARTGLIHIFCARGLWNSAEDLADITLDRAARRLVEKSDTTEPVENVLSFMRGVASKVAGEARRRPLPIPLEDAPEPVSPAVEEDVPAEVDLLRLDCLRELIRSLPREDRAAILDYYADSKYLKIARRKRLALESGRSAGALRVKMHRIRRFLLRELSMRFGAPAASNPDNKAAGGNR